MIISHTHKFVFFSFPKAGSESVRALLAPYNEERIRPWLEHQGRGFYPHMPPRDVAVMFARRGWDFDSYRRITCIRNPYARLVSLYRMICRVDGVWKFRARCGVQPGFNRWVLSTRPGGRGGGGRPYQRWRRYGTWSVEQWISDAAGVPLVTGIVRLEDLAQGPAPLLDLLGLPVAPLPVRNCRPPVDPATWFSAPALRVMAHRYAGEIREFGYSLPAGCRAGPVADPRPPARMVLDI
jgi:hypothetical protein